VYRRVKPVLNVLLLYCRRHRCGRGEHHFRMYRGRFAGRCSRRRRRRLCQETRCNPYTHTRRVMEGVVMIPCYTDVQGAPKMYLKKSHLFYNSSTCRHTLESQSILVLSVTVINGEFSVIT